MKRLAAAAVLVILSAMAAFGAVQDFGKFTLDIPNGWKAEVLDDLVDFIIEITKSDKSSSMKLTYAGTGEAPFDGIDDWLEFYDSPSKVERTEDGYYTFTFKDENGKKGTLYARRASEATPHMYMSVDMFGKDTKTMKAIRDSFALKGTGGKKTSSADDSRDANGNTKLILAAVRGNTEVVNSLTEAGADPNIQNKWGMNALMYAAEGNHVDTIYSLLEAHADLNATNGEGSTALMIAAIHGCEEAMEALMEAGAKVKLKNNSGKSAVDYARENRDLKGSNALKQLEKFSK